MSPKWPETLQGQMYPIYVLLVSLTPKLQSKKCTEWPQNDLEPYKVKLTHTCIISILESQISARFTVRPAVFEITPFWDKCNKWTQNDLEPYKVKCTPYITSIPGSQISLPFIVKTSHFQDTVTLVYKDPPRNQHNVVLIHRWSLYASSI